MSTNPTLNSSPLARLFNLLARGRWSARHYGPTLGALFLDAQEGLMREHQLELALVAGEAAALDERTQGFCAKIAAIFADGIVDRAERLWLKRHLPALTTATRAHARHLEKLAQAATPNEP